MLTLVGGGEHVNEDRKDMLFYSYWASETGILSTPSTGEDAREEAGPLKSPNESASGNCHFGEEIQLLAYQTSRGLVFSAVLLVGIHTRKKKLAVS